MRIETSIIFNETAEIDEDLPLGLESTKIKVGMFCVVKSADIIKCKFDLSRRPVVN